MNEIGNRIRYHRLELNMTQSDLAEGIISVSYLSKIENGLIEPPQKIIDFLCKELNINPYLQERKKYIFMKLTRDWFEALFKNDIHDAQNLYIQIEKNNALIEKTESITLIDIHKLKYFLLQEKNEEARRQYEMLQILSVNFNNIENYYWLKFSAYYKFRNLYYNKSLEYFNQAKKYLSSTFYLEDEEENGLYYMIALSASHARKTYKAQNYAKKALQFYQKNYHLKQAAQCHILLGISFSRIAEYEEAIKSYKLAEKISRTINDISLLATSIQNIGNLYSIINKSQESIEYYLKSYNLQVNSTHKMKIIPIASLMKEYYRRHDIFNANYWLSEGISLLSQDESESVYQYEFQVYEQLINGINQDFDDIILKKIIPFLNEKGLHYEKVAYLKILAQYYFDTRKYKLSAIYYNHALNIN
ncbi:helix-turn-helix domain-containing protein [Paraliobacillus zengyii]|uniref:helix-turn-helix domain-containing protein n=1 Tax=Paraliobacillus zengyii TaxID=2213194 RepID=UPI000DD4DDE7|nr:helix-turn-helix transcriptional regulator [Paraliobacillus zengyii]